jgi:hypothetical protein
VEEKLLMGGEGGEGGGINFLELSKNEANTHF